MLIREQRTVRGVEGPLLFLERVPEAALGQMVSILREGEARRGQVIAVSQGHAVIQVLGSSTGLDTEATVVRLEEREARVGLGPDVLGRCFDGIGRPIDGLPAPLPRVLRPVAGSALNPVARDVPERFVETGISAIDGLNTLVRGQKLPIFSGPGLPGHELAAQILRQARVADDEGGFAVVFAAMGVTHREAGFFLDELERSGASDRAVLFLNRADEPAVERLLTPRYALATAEFLAFDMGRHVLVILTDMTHYCEVLREVAAAREEVPGRRGYPGYMYTDLASIYERAGRVRGMDGSITQVPILTMPDDDLTHPIPDLTGYITEGQIVLSRELHRRGVRPPIDVLPSLSRLMRKGITRPDHGPLSDQIYALYAQGRDVRRLAAVVGEAGLSDEDRALLRFVDAFEARFLDQGDAARSLRETLELGWELLRDVPRRCLTRLSAALVDEHLGVVAGDGGV